MDREFAILVLNACYRASSEIGGIGVAVEQFAPEDDGRAIKLQAGFVVAEIGRLTEAVFKAHPDLEQYVEHQIDKFGRLS